MSSNASILDYDNFVPIIGAYGNKKFRVHIAPHPVDSATQINVNK